MLSSAVEAVIPSSVLISEAVAVTPSRMLSSAVDAVIPSSVFNSVAVAERTTSSLIFGDVRVLFVSVYVSDVPTISPVVP